MCKTTIGALPKILAKPLRRRFLEYVVDSVGEINLLIWRIYPLRYDIMVLES
jgi:hypothetical protein